MTGAKQSSDCTGCQPGYICEYGDRTPEECPPGKYCPVLGSGIIYRKLVYDCPVSTWSPWSMRVYKSDCLNCTEGYYCNTTGISNITLLECPKGSYCPEATG